jgi:hypothetical protein
MALVSRRVVRALLLALAFHLALGAAAECVSVCGDEDGSRDCATACCRTAPLLLVMDVARCGAAPELIGAVPERTTGPLSSPFVRDILHVPRAALT